jgi:large subunit ribosomal protein L24
MKIRKTKLNKIHIKQGDTVKVLSGNSKNKIGKVLQVIPEKYRAVVEGVNMVYKHIKPSAKNPQGTRIQKEGTIHISNLMYVDESSGVASRVGRKLNEAGKLQRYLKKTGNIINYVRS